MDILVLPVILHFGMLAFLLGCICFAGHLLLTVVKKSFLSSCALICHSVTFSLPPDSRESFVEMAAILKGQAEGSVRQLRGRKPDYFPVAVVPGYLEGFFSDVYIYSVEVCRTKWNQICFY